MILVSVNDCQYWLLQTVALRRPIPGFIKCENSLFNGILFTDKLILLLFCVFNLTFLVPSYLELFLNKTTNSVKITLQTRHYIPNSYVNSTIICGTYLWSILQCQFDASEYVLYLYIREDSCQVREGAKGKDLFPHWHTTSRESNDSIVYVRPLVSFLNPKGGNWWHLSPHNHKYTDSNLYEWSPLAGGSCCWFTHSSEYAYMQ